MPTVLLVHSSVEVRCGWVEVLRGLGVHFRTVPNLAAAASVMAREPIAAIVADLDGGESVTELHWATLSVCQPPLVLVSSSEVPSMASRASGVAVVPPNWPGGLRCALRTLLATRSNRASLPLRTPPLGVGIKWSQTLGGDPLETADDTWTGDHALA